MLSLRPRLAALPRETRDTLLLLAVIAWVLLLQAGQLPVWCSALALALLLGRGWLALRQRALPHWSWRIALLGLALAATWLDYRTLLGQQPGVALVTLLLALKTLELRARRDAFVIFFLGFFVLLTRFFHSQSLPTALGIVVALLGLIAALVNAQLPLGRPPLLQSLRLAGRMMLLGTPLMLLLFLLFPRLAPLWGLPADALGGRSGLSERMQVGQVARLALDSSLAFRVRFEGPPPGQDKLYFRGPVLSQFDGVEWLPAPPGAAAAGTVLRVEGEPVRYQVTLEPSHQHWLFVLEATPQTPALPGYQPYVNAELQWFTERPLSELVRYEARSHTRFSYGLEATPGALQPMLALPAGYNPRTLALARQLRQEIEPASAAGRDAGSALVARALELLRQGGYRYTLEPGIYGRDSADEFWFDRRAGFCEHIAASFVILLRAAGVPARIVTGYQGGEHNPVDGYWSVRHSDAHAWAEVWLRGQGWTRVDPTAAVLPERIEGPQRLQPAAGLLADALIRVSPGLAVQLRQLWEAVNQRRNHWVLDYSQARQLELLGRLGLPAGGTDDLVRLLAGLLAALSLAGAIWALRQGRGRDPWLDLLQLARHRLRQAGYPVTAQATPRQLARLLQTDAASARRWPALQQWLLELERQRYDPSSTRQLAELRRQARQLDWPPPSHPSVLR